MSPLRSLFGSDAAILRERDFQLLLLTTMLPVLGSAVVSPVMDALIDPFGTTPANISLMISVFTAPAIVTIPLSGVLADRIGRKPVLVVGLVLFGLGGTAIAFTTNYTLVLACRLVQGIGFGGLNPIVITSIGDLYTGGREATGQGLRFMMSGFSGALFPVFAGMVLAVGWQYPFFLYAMAFPIAAMVFLWFEEPTGDSSVVTHGGTERAYVRRLLGLLRHRRVLAVVAARSLMTGVWIGFLTYNSLIVVRVMDGTAAQAGLLVSVFSLLTGLTASQTGRVAAWFDTKYRPLVLGHLVVFLGFTGSLFAPVFEVAFAGIALTGVGMGVIGGLYRSLLTEVAPESYRAGVVSVAETGGRVTNTLIPAGMGAVVAVASPVFGLPAALRLAGVGVALLVTGGGIVGLLVARYAPPVPAGNR